jgi:WD40 repeat protein
MKKLVCCALLMTVFLKSVSIVDSQTPVTSFVMPIPLESLRPITVDNADEVIELGWFRVYHERDKRYAVYAVALSPDGTLVASGGFASMTIWILPTGDVLASIPHEGEIRKIVFSSDNKLMATAAITDYPQSAVQIWDTATGTERLFLNYPTRIQSVAFNLEAAC